MKKIVFLIFIFALAGCVKEETKGEDFSFITIDGEIKKLSDYRGKVIIVDFMATWCYPCHVEMEELKKIVEHYGNNITVISISVSPTDNANKIKSTFGNYINYWIFGMDRYGIAENYSIEAIPTIYIVNGNGEIEFTHVGVISADELMQKIDELL